MLKKLGHVLTIAHSLVREHITKKVARSSEWPTVRKKFMAQNPTCSSCGGTTLLQVHHCVPFHDNPDLELEPSNLITLCMSLKLCHVKIGHGGSFKSFSPTVRPDASEVRKHPDKFELVAELAEQNRKPNQPGETAGS